MRRPPTSPLVRSHSSRAVVLVTVAALVPVAALAALAVAPLVTVGAVAAVVGLAVARTVAGAVGGYRRGHDRVCVPGTDACVEV